ncbi:helix-turn-helix domain-containing protein [Pseudomonas antarctica]|uniref:helix-turn-helix domain-containing protein n=1 Tax=Pseudomonas antarctica TaxID=219572 RepID=UPI0039C05B75
MDIDKAFGAVLRELREHRQINQAGFGSAASRNYIGLLEQGKHSPTLDKIGQIAEVLGVDPLVLILLAYDKAGEQEVGASGRVALNALKLLMVELG